MSKQTKIKFCKYEGTGNDFIMIDGINNIVPKLSSDLIQQMCNRRFGIGADGVIILKTKENYDFEMAFYNSDGNKGTMCGNGGRCIVAFAHNLGIIKNSTVFFAPDGEHVANVESENEISLKMQDVNEIHQHKQGLFIDTGSPHLLIFTKNNDFETAYKQGKKIRYSNDYKNMGGVNVNFINITKNKINLITYERGVEDITYSCGTGSVATALAVNLKHNKKSPIEINTKGGVLKIEFKHTKNSNFVDIWLKAKAKKIFEGNFYF